MKYSGLYTFDKDTHKYVPITSTKEIWDIEEDDDMRFHRPHPCNHPWRGGEFMYEENHPEHGPYCWNYKEDKNG